MNAQPIPTIVPPLSDTYAAFMAARAAHRSALNESRELYVSGYECPAVDDWAAAHDERAEALRADALAGLVALSGLSVDALREVVA